MRRLGRSAALPLLGAALVVYAGVVLSLALASDWDIPTLTTSAVAALGLAALMSCLNYLLRGLRFHTLVSTQTDRATYRGSLIVFVSALSLSATPARVGDLVRIGMMSRWYGVKVRASAPICVFDRMFDLAAVACLGAVSVLFVPELGSSYPAWWIATAATFGLILICGGLYLVALFVVPWMPRPVRRLLALLKVRRPVRHRFPAAFGLSLAAWMCEGVAVALVLWSLGGTFQIMTGVFVHSIALLAGALTFLPGGIGGAEAAAAFMLVQLDWTLESAVAAAILIRLTTFWLAILLGSITWGLASVAHRRREAVAGKEGA